MIEGLSTSTQENLWRMGSQLKFAPLPANRATCMTSCMDDGLHDVVLHATSSRSKQADRKSSNGKMRGVIILSNLPMKGGFLMLSEADLRAKRAALRWLAQQHPEWTHQELADALSLSRLPS